LSLLIYKFRLGSWCQPYTRSNGHV